MKKCKYYGYKVGMNNTTRHKNFKEYHEFLLDAMIDKLKTNLDILQRKKLSI